MPAKEKSVAAQGFEKMRSLLVDKTFGKRTPFTMYGLKYDKPWLLEIAHRTQRCITNFWSGF